MLRMINFGVKGVIKPPCNLVFVSFWTAQYFRTLIEVLFFRLKFRASITSHMMTQWVLSITMWMRKLADFEGCNVQMFFQWKLGLASQVIVGMWKGLEVLRDAFFFRPTHSTSSVVLPQKCLLSCSKKSLDWSSTLRIGFHSKLVSFMLKDVSEAFIGSCVTLNQMFGMMQLLWRCYYIICKREPAQEGHKKVWAVGKKTGDWGQVVSHWNIWNKQEKLYTRNLDIDTQNSLHKESNTFSKPSFCINPSCKVITTGKHLHLQPLMGPWLFQWFVKTNLVFILDLIQMLGKSKTTIFYQILPNGGEKWWWFTMV